jgi:hypothetical protein
MVDERLSPGNQLDHALELRTQVFGSAQRAYQVGLKTQQAPGIHGSLVDPGQAAEHYPAFHGLQAGFCAALAVYQLWVNMH